MEKNLDGKLHGVLDVLYHLTPGAVGQGGLKSRDNGVMTNVLTTSQSQDSAEVTAKKLQRPKLEREQLWK